MTSTHSPSAWRTGSSGPWRPTIAHVRAAAAAVMLLAIGALTQRPDLVVLATPFAIVTAWSTLTRPTKDPVLEDRYGNSVVREGDATTWRGRVRDAEAIDVISARITPAPWLQTVPEEGAVSIPVTDGTATLAMTVRSMRWGRRLIDPVRLFASSSWGAFQCPMTTSHTSMTTLPVPAVFDAAAPMRPTDGLVGLYRSTRVGEGGEFASLRNFVVGDRMRRINWPRSLRSDELQVNATWADQDTHVAFIVDATDDYGVSAGIDGSSSSLDTTVRAVGAIAEHYSRRGDRTSLRVFGTLAQHAVPAASGAAHLRRLLETLTRMRPAGASISSYRGLGNRQWPASGAELTVMLSPLVAREALDRAVALGRQGLPVVIVDTLPDDITVDDDPYTSLAWRIRRLERTREIRRVRQVGIPVIRWHGPGSLDQFLRDVARRSAAPKLRVR